MRRFVVLVAVLATLLLLVSEREAAAYPWLMRHDYTACATCHVDPSGAGLLNLYGRAQSEVLLRTHWTPSDGEDPSAGGFLFGLLPLDEKGPLFQADARALLLHVRPPAPAPSVTRVVLMQADAAAGAQVDRVRVAGTLGYVHEGAQAASVTHGSEDRLVSRQHWLGVGFGEGDAFLLRGGRMNVPFGLRTIEHTLGARRLTRTDINAAQQHGLAFAYTQGSWRGEVMAIAGNMQIAPPELRERGYSGYLELAPSSSVAVGASSAILHTELDLETVRPTFRQAHGVFGRVVVAKPVVLLAEVDVLARSARRRTIEGGFTSFLQADVEPVQGLHLMATGESSSAPGQDGGITWGAWGSVSWFFAPHADLRVDSVWQSVPAGPSRADVVTLLGQVHVWL